MGTDTGTLGLGNLRKMPLFLVLSPNFSIPIIAFCTFMEEELSGRCTAGRMRLPPTVAPQKVELLNPEEYKADKTMITVILYEEDHTVGNALKHIICQMPGVEFCGYNVPHPLEDKILVRIQTVDGVAAGDVLLRGLEDLAQIFGTIERKFKSAHRKHFGGTAQDNDDDA